MPPSGYVGLPYDLPKAHEAGDPSKKLPVTCLPPPGAFKVEVVNWVGCSAKGKGGAETLVYFKIIIRVEKSEAKPNLKPLKDQADDGTSVESEEIGTGKSVPQSRPTDNGGFPVDPQFIMPEPQPYLLTPPQQSNLSDGFGLFALGEKPELMEPTSKLTEKEKELAKAIGKSIASKESGSKDSSGGGGSEEEIIIIEEPEDGGGSGGGSEQENTQPQGQRSAS